jgi:alpha-beta hydrolase superfamily lysophospholipase
VTERAGAALSGARGVEIYWQSWLPDQPPRAVAVIVHGLGEHSDRYDHVARALNEDAIAVYACDHRGHGRSQGARELVEVELVVSDVDQLVGLAAAAHPGLPVFMLGHSFGGMIAVQYALAHQDRLVGLILSGALASVDASPVLRRIGHLLATIAPRAPLIALDAELVSRDPTVVAAYRADPLVHHGRIPARTAAQIADTTDTFPARVGAITLPALVMYGTADGLCPPSGSVMLAEEFGAEDVTIRAYEGLYHEIFNEPERETVIGDLRGWLAERIA